MNPSHQASETPWQAAEFAVTFTSLNSLYLLRCVIEFSSSIKSRQQAVGSVRRQKAIFSTLFLFRVSEPARRPPVAFCQRWAVRGEFKFFNATTFPLVAGGGR